MLLVVYSYIYSYVATGHTVCACVCIYNYCSHSKMPWSCLIAQRLCACMHSMLIQNDEASAALTEAMQALTTTTTTAAAPVRPSSAARKRVSSAVKQRGK